MKNRTSEYHIPDRPVKYTVMDDHGCTSNRSAEVFKIVGTTVYFVGGDTCNVQNVRIVKKV